MSIKSMACHVLAMGGNPDKDSEMNDRYNVAANGLIYKEAPDDATNFHKQLFKIVQDRVGSARGLNTRKSPPLEYQAAALNYLVHYCRNLSTIILPMGAGIETKVWGFFDKGEYAPQHMWIEVAGCFYDTMPDKNVKKVISNDDGTNPGWEHNLLSNDSVCWIPGGQITTYQQLAIESAMDG